MHALSETCWPNGCNARLLTERAGIPQRQGPCNTPACSGFVKRSAAFAWRSGARPTTRSWPYCLAMRDRRRLTTVPPDRWPPTARSIRCMTPRKHAASSRRHADYAHAFSAEAFGRASAGGVLMWSNSPPTASRQYALAHCVEGCSHARAASGHGHLDTSNVPKAMRECR